MVNLTTYELRLIAGKIGIKNYKNMSREKLLSTLDELERNFKALSEKGLERIAKMQIFFTKLIRANHKNAKPILKWTGENRKDETY